MVINLNKIQIKFFFNKKQLKDNQSLLGITGEIWLPGFQSDNRILIYTLGVFYLKKESSYRCGILRRKQIIQKLI